jgi:hypothetical protein
LAKPVFDELIVVDVHQGETLFIPSYTWIQIEWIETGFFVNHYGMTEPLEPSQLYILNCMPSIWKLFIESLQTLTTDLLRHKVITWLSCGRHPRGELPEAGLVG